MNQYDPSAEAHSPRSITPQLPASIVPVVAIVEYDPAWPEQFQQVSNKLKDYLSISQVKYLSIEHVGSTAVPGLAAKAIIDVVIEVPDAQNAELAKEALIHEPPPEEYYNHIGDGGIRGRISMKPNDRNAIPGQSVYILNRENPEARLIMKCHRALCHTLRLPEHEELKLEYGRAKIELASSSRNGVEYGQRKNAIIRKILKAAGWTDDEVDAKESLDYRIAGEDLDAPY